MKVTLSLAVLAALGLLGGCMATSSPSARPSTSGQPPTFTPDELELLRALWIGSLPPLPDDPSNRYADDPAAAALGESFFFDARFSANGRVSCSSCHQPELAFTDGLPRGRGIGETPRSTMSVLGTAYAPFLFWDGRKDSQWALSQSPTSPSEMSIAADAKASERRGEHASAAPARDSARPAPRAPLLRQFVPRAWRLFQQREPCRARADRAGNVERVAGPAAEAMHHPPLRRTAERGDGDDRPGRDGDRVAAEQADAERAWSRRAPSAKAASHASSTSPARPSASV